MKSRYFRKITPYLAGACLLTLISCGGDSSSSSAPPPQAEQPSTEAVAGQFKVTMTALNTNTTVTGNPSAVGEISIKDDDVGVTIAGSGIRPSDSGITLHIHNGTACPTEANDANADGFVDAAESIAATGPILIPLDSDINSQAAGAGATTGVVSGFITYRETGSLASMLADLHAPDENPADSIAKLNPASGLNLTGKVVEMHGVADSATLPATVVGLDGGTPQASLPIACGVIEKLLPTLPSGTTTP